MSQFARVIAVMTTLFALAACSTDSSATNPSSSTSAENQLPSLKGVVIFHRYSDYSAWDSKLYMINLQTRQSTQVGADWKTVISPINAHFSPDGQYFTFTASAAGLEENDWDIFVSHWNGTRWAEPENLTGPNNQRDEDPKFSPDGKTIVFKRDGVLTTIDKDGQNLKFLTDGTDESSMPYFSSDGKKILFEKQNKIWLYDNGLEIQMKTIEGLSTYYPIGVDEEKFLYTQIQSTRHDAIYFGYYDGREPKRLFFNSEDFESSDSYPYENGSQFIFYVSTNPMSWMSSYNLFFADIQNEVIYDMDKLVPGTNTDLIELGPAWSGTAPYGA